MPGKYSVYLTHKECHEGFPHDDNNQNNLDNAAYCKNFRATLTRNKNSKLLISCISVTFTFALVEGFGGYFSNSIALQSDAVHMLTDAAGLLVAYFANSISKRPANTTLTFGYGKAEAVGALINCIFTLILTIGLLVEVIMRFFVPIQVNSCTLLVLASMGFIVNGILALILSRNAQSLNIKAAKLHALGDLLASAIAIIAGLIIYFTNFSFIDPILSLIVIGVLIVSNYKLIKKSVMVLMAGVPENLEYELIGRDLEAISGVNGVHDLHVWYMSANKPALSAHVVVADPYLWKSILYECQQMLLNKYQIEHITLQQESEIV